MLSSVVFLQRLLTIENDNIIMKILFLTIGLPDMSRGGGFYADLIQEMSNSGIEVTALSPTLPNQESGVYKEGSCRVLRVNVPFLKRNTSLLIKGLGSLALNPCYIIAYKKYLDGQKFDYVFLPTPPATMIEVAKVIKKKSGAKLYVILRDIQPECSDRRAVSQSVLNRHDVYDECKKPFGINRLAYKYLYKKSQQLYKLADFIGCMSPGNMEFVKQIAPYVEDSKNVLLPNWYKETNLNEQDNSAEIRKKYDLTDKFVAIFGGNVGPQQAIWNIATLAKHFKSQKDIVFVVVGRGTKMGKLKEIAANDHLVNIMFMSYMPRNEYEHVLKMADVGLISLDEKYKVPTCPSKVIGYMALHQPIVAMINEGSDYGKFYIDRPGCGLWSAGLDNEKMFANFEWMYTHPEERKAMGEAGYKYYKEHFDVKMVCKQLLEQLSNG